MRLELKPTRLMEFKTNTDIVEWDIYVEVPIIATVLRLSCGVQVDKSTFMAGLLKGLTTVADLMEVPTQVLQHVALIHCKRFKAAIFPTLS